MRSRRRSVLLAAVTVAVVAGCSFDGSGGLPRADLMLRNAAVASSSAASAHIEMQTTGTVPGLTFSRLEADVVRGTPGASRGVVTLQATGVRIEFIEADGTLYVTGPNGAFAPAPEQAGSSVPRPSRMLDPDRGLGSLMAGLRNPTTVVKQDVAGVEAFELTGEVPPEVLADMLPGTKTGAEFTVWLQVGWPHAPVKTSLIFPGDPPSSLDIKVTNVNKPMTITAPNEESHG